MKHLCYLALLLFACAAEKETPTPVFITSNGAQSATYHQTIDFWEQMAQQNENTQLWEVGHTDAGLPLHLVTWNAGNITSWKDLKNSNKTVFFINNGIHPGEPDGIDACQWWLWQMHKNPAMANRLSKVVLAMVPVYNVGGALKRNSHSRANQNGPEAYGFRGNAQNLDLNRDCIKMDSKNAAALAQLFHHLDPDLFVDTHVSNGADYQHVVTLLEPQKDKLGYGLGTYVNQTLNPFLYQAMQDSFPMVPYVNVWGRAPQRGGIYQFIDWPRYANGYAALHFTPAYTIETHMLKPFKQRTEGTLALLKHMATWLQNNGEELQQQRKAAVDHYLKTPRVAYDWEIDTTVADTVPFMGYAYEESSSALDPNQKLFTYNKKVRVDTSIAYYNTYTATRFAEKPKYYVLQRGYHQVAEKLQNHGVSVQEVEKDSTVSAKVHYIKSYQTVPQPYEKHYLHYEVATTDTVEEITLQPGDFLIPVRGKSARILLETLTPEATDSYFAWNAFDAILQQKEGYSPYVWDKKAAELLHANPELAARFEAAKKDSEVLRNSLSKQQRWVYEHSAYYEDRHLRYPVFSLF